MSKDKIINRTIERLKELTGEDFHGYRSEVWSEISIAMEEYKDSKVHLPDVVSPAEPTRQEVSDAYVKYDFLCRIKSTLNSHERDCDEYLKVTNIIKENKVKAKAGTGGTPV